jgi:hypothetical protein
MTKPADPKNYIYPPRSSAAVPREATGIYEKMGFIAQLKYNDSHALIKILPNTENPDNPIVQLWNRHGERLKYTPPEHLQAQLQQLPKILGLDKDKWHLLDGGLLDSRHRAIKDTIAIWDILVKNGQHQLGTTYQERYNNDLARSGTCGFYTYTHSISSGEKTYNLGVKFTDNIILPINHTADQWNDLWALIGEINEPFTDKKTGEVSPLIEGLVMKDLSGTLEPGRKEDNNSHWIGRSRVATKRHRF